MKYQEEYAAGRPQMYDTASRVVRAQRIVKLLIHYYDGKISKLKVLDVGASTGIIDNELAKHFGKITGIDIDKGAIAHARKTFKPKNLVFKHEDAMDLSFKDNSFDLVICTHVYEHVPDSRVLFKEIYRVLKPGGVCYLAAINRLWPLEPHYDLPFLSYLPKSIANKYVKIFGKADKYWENPETYWKLQKITSDFEIKDYTAKILKEPKRFGFDDKITSKLQFIAKLLSPASTYFAPSFFWLLIKDPTEGDKK